MNPQPKITKLWTANWILQAFSLGKLLGSRRCLEFQNLKLKIENTHGLYKNMSRKTSTEFNLEKYGTASRNQIHQTISISALKWTKLYTKDKRDQFFNQLIDYWVSQLVLYLRWCCWIWALKMKPITWTMKLWWIWAGMQIFHLTKAVFYGISH